MSNPTGARSAMGRRKPLGWLPWLLLLLLVIVVAVIVIVVTNVNDDDSGAITKIDTASPIVLVAGPAAAA